MSFLNHFDAKHEATRKEFIAKYGPDYDLPTARSTFSLNRAEQGAVDEWIASLRAEIMPIQKRTMADTPFQDIISDEPYYGATGGGITYAFLPTSLGTICVVTESITKKSLNVAEATNWFFYG